MTVHDLWHLKPREDPVTGKMIHPPSKRYGRGKRWRVTWTDPNNPAKELTDHFDKKTDAIAKDKIVGASIIQGQYVDSVAAKQLVRDCLDKWRLQRLHDLQTADTVERFFRNHVIDEPLGQMPRGSVRSSDIQAWVSGRSKVLAGSTIVNVGYMWLKAAFSTWHDDGDIGRNPCTRRISLPSSKVKDRYIPTPAEVHRLNDAVADCYKPIPLVAAGCGLRPSEIFGLERKHLNFLRREIIVEQQVKRTKELGCYIGKPKTATSTRVVEMSEGMAAELSKHLKAHPPKTVRMFDRRDPRPSHHVERDVELVFTSSLDRPIYNALWSAMWGRAVKRAKIGGHLGLHGLRHYFATLLIHNGASVKTVQLALGHATPTITLDTYLHDWPDLINKTRDIVEAGLFGPDDEDEEASG